MTVSCSLSDVISTKQLIIVGGKGGTGKTLMAASLGLALASRNKRVLVIEASAVGNLPPLLNFPKVNHKITQVNRFLFATNIDPTHCFEEYVVSHLGMARLYERVFRHRRIKSFLDTMPGLAETMLLGRIFHDCALADPPFDHVIFDAPASGHMLSLLTTPQAILSTGVGGPLVAEVSRVLEFFGDAQKVGVVLACLPESLVVSETMDFLRRLKEETTVATMGLVLNRFVGSEDVAETEARCSDINTQPLLKYVQARGAASLEAINTLRLGLREVGLAPSLIHLVQEFGLLAGELRSDFAANLWNARNCRESL